jgi:predicted N-acyltransferase
LKDDKADVKASIFLNFSLQTRPSYFWKTEIKINKPILTINFIFFNDQKFSSMEKKKILHKFSQRFPFTCTQLHIFQKYIESLDFLRRNSNKYDRKVG